MRPDVPQLPQMPGMPQQNSAVSADFNSMMGNNGGPPLEPEGQAMDELGTAHRGRDIPQYVIQITSGRRIIMIGSSEAEVRRIACSEHFVLCWR
jgi:hypothetical protein